MRTIKLLVAYDGTDFCGWQRQEGRPDEVRPSIQAAIESALEQLHRHPVAVTGAGRTDSGVHAAGQAAHFHSDIKSIKPERFVPALNGLLPQSIRVRTADEVNPDFHARFDARMRTYRYHFICGRQALPHESRYALQVWRNPRIDLLNAYCRLILGERDCSMFAGANDASKSRNRYIAHAGFHAEGCNIIFEISANAFLWKMVRSIAGTFMHHEERGTPPDLLGDLIASGLRNRAGPTLPPHGLFLWKVDYYRNVWYNSCLDK